MIVAFSFVGPLGILIGELLSNSQLLTAIFFAISSGSFIIEGTFIYIAASEIIVEEFSLSK